MRRGFRAIVKMKQGTKWVPVSEPFATKGKAGDYMGYLA